MSFKKVFALVMLLLLVLMPTSDVYAMDRGGKRGYDEIIAKYGLKIAMGTPQGVSPIKVNSPEELEAVLQQFSIKQLDTHTDIIESPEQPPVPDATTMAENATTYGTVTRSCSASTGTATFNTWADIRVGYSGSFRWIDSVLNTRTGLTGITYGLSMSDSYSYSYNQSSSSVSVKGDAIINAYILLNTGMTTVYSTSVSCSFTYSVY
ncbi:MAG: hypothetical protein MI924_08255 [Chloroflexales bacterium]|nr:hypothetical protein [Chloroflexales bacterium]